jgi:CDP-diacylglycerol pyrophosphatase
LQQKRGRDTFIKIPIDQRSQELMNPKKRRLTVAIVGLIFLIGLVAYAYWRIRFNPNILWEIVESCVTQNRAGRLMAGSCVAVDQQEHVAILHSITARSEFLLVPTTRVTGIEDPYVLSPSAPNYWALAWTAAQRYLPADVARDRTRIGLAINSVKSRSQNQLHIHISCIKHSVTAVLDANQDGISTSWSPPTIELEGRDYRALRIRGPNLGSNNPFRLLTSIPQASQHMGAHTLVLVGALWDGGKQQGFYLLDDFTHETVDNVDDAYGEDLLDENCRSSVALMQR